MQEPFGGKRFFPNEKKKPAGWARWASQRRWWSMALRVLDLDLYLVLLTHVNKVLDLIAVGFRDLVNAFVLLGLVAVLHLNFRRLGLAVGHRARHGDDERAFL